MKKLSAVLIVRDEEHFLPGCLESLDGLVDEVVVVDTGSVDATVSIAEAAGARVEQLDWPGDFATARNHGLDLATGDWILSIDADERVRGDRAVIDPMLGDERFVGALVAFQPAAGYARYWELRLFRNRPDIRFVGVIHESVREVVRQIVDREGLGVVAVDVAIDHLGYDTEQTAKHHRNLPLLRARLEDDPNHPYSWDHLGRVLSALGDDDGAVDAWQRGVEIALSSPTVIPQDWLPFHSLILYRAAHGEPIDDLLGRAEELFGPTASILLVRATAAMTRRDYGVAANDLESLIAMDGANVVTDGLAMPISLYNEIAWGLLATCRFELGEFEAAANAFDEAYRFTPAPEFKAKATVARAKARGR